MNSDDFGGFLLWKLPAKASFSISIGFDMAEKILDLLNHHVLLLNGWDYMRVGTLRQEKNQATPCSCKGQTRLRQWPVRGHQAPQGQW